MGRDGADTLEITKFEIRMSQVSLAQRTTLRLFRVSNCGNELRTHLVKLGAHHEFSLDSQHKMFNCGTDDLGACTRKRTRGVCVANSAVLQ